MDLKGIGKRKVVTVEREASLSDASRIMREAHVGDVVVVDQQGAHPVPVGILTDRDIVVGTIAIGASLEAFTVGDMMTSTLVTAREDEPLEKVISLMKEHGIKRVPLVDQARQLAGIITIEDIMQFLATELSTLAEVAHKQQEMEFQRRRKIA